MPSIASYCKYNGEFVIVGVVAEDHPRILDQFMTNSQHILTISPEPMAAVALKL